MRKILQGAAIVFFFSFISTPSNATSKDEVTLGFFVQGDDINFWGDTKDTVDNIQNLHDGINCPRSRFYIRGKTTDWAYSLMYTASTSKLLEAYLRYERSDFYSITIGQDKVPYSFWFQSAIDVLNCFERGLPITGLTDKFQTQLKTQFYVSPFTLSLALVGPEPDNTIYRFNSKGHVPLAGVARITFAPVHTQSEALHFAVAGIFQDTDSAHRFRFQAFPEIQTAPNKFLVNTGFIYHCQNFIGNEMEAVAILRSLSLTAEAYQEKVHRAQDFQDLNFEGFFTTIEYFLTGEHYIYDFKNGAVNKISKIRHCYGAWQVVARYSKLNLDSADIHGGRERNTTLGLNWYVNDNLQLRLNYIYVDTFPSDNGLPRKVNILAFRCQLAAHS
jgi:phosphate-selective porin OprO and OprP